MPRREYEFKTVCAWCKAPSEYVSTTPLTEGRGPPDEGTYSICMYCGEISVIDNAAKGRCRKPDMNEIYHLSSNRYVQIAKEAWADTVGKTQRKH